MEPERRYPMSMKQRIELRRQNIKKSKSAPSQSTSQSLEQFLFFSKLPMEIRTAIWQITTKEGRIVEVYALSDKGWVAPVPSILHVCSESRGIGLKYYELAFSAKDRHTGKSYPARIYFNFDYDTLYFHKYWNYSVKGLWRCLTSSQTMFWEEDTQRIKYLCVDIDTRICSTNKNAYRGHSPRMCEDLWCGIRSFYYLIKQKPTMSPTSIRDLFEVLPEDYSNFANLYRKAIYEKLLCLEDLDNVAFNDDLKVVQELKQSGLSYYFNDAEPFEAAGTKFHLVYI